MTYRGVVVLETGTSNVSRRRRVFAAAVIGTGLLVGTACGSHTTQASPPSQAAAAASSEAKTEEFKGTYRVAYADDLASTWTVTPCGQGCVDVALTSDDATSNGLNGQAKLKDGRWSMQIWSPDDTICSDGRKIPGLSQWAWDAATLNGELAATPGDPCGDGSPVPGVTFTMTKKSSDALAPGQGSY
jgi:hypothetical protein